MPDTSNFLGALGNLSAIPNAPANNIDINTLKAIQDTATKLQNDPINPASMGSGKAAWGHLLSVLAGNLYQQKAGNILAQQNANTGQAAANASDVIRQRQNVNNQATSDTQPIAGIEPQYIDAIKQSEGYAPKAAWDYHQYTNGYGTKATSPDETVDQDTANKRFSDEITKAKAQVDSFAPNAPPGVKAALISLTYNSGTAWMNAGLGNSIKNGDYNTAQSQFLQYNKAGGQTLPGLANRRQQEAQWFNAPAATPEAAAGASQTQGAALPIGGPTQTAISPQGAPYSFNRQDVATLAGSGQHGTDVIPLLHEMQANSRPGSVIDGTTTTQVTPGGATATQNVPPQLATGVGNIPGVIVAGQKGNPNFAPLTPGQINSNATPKSAEDAAIMGARINAAGTNATGANSAGLKSMQDYIEDLPKAPQRVQAWQQLVDTGGSNLKGQLATGVLGEPINELFKTFKSVTGKDIVDPNSIALKDALPVINSQIGSNGTSHLTTNQYDTLAKSVPTLLASGTGFKVMADIGLQKEQQKDALNHIAAAYTPTGPDGPAKAAEMQAQYIKEHPLQIRLPDQNGVMQPLSTIEANNKANTPSNPTGKTTDGSSWKLIR